MLSTDIGVSALVPKFQNVTGMRQTYQPSFVGLSGMVLQVCISSQSLPTAQIPPAVS